ncbi:MAG: YidC/Oxa1 family membrane protein insertase [Acidimicrobiales bacterium]
MTGPLNGVLLGSLWAHVAGVVPLVGSTIGKIFQPLFEVMAYLLAFFYALVPNYAVAIALLTIVVMLISAPLTIKSTLSMAAMQRVAPELKKLQQKYKGDRQRLNEEMMQLYRENGVNPMGGCLPMLLQMPLFIILYDCVRGLTTTITRGTKYPTGFPVSEFGVKCQKAVCSDPRYISHNTKLFASLIHNNGKMPSFGIDLASKAFSHHTVVQALPFIFLILAAIGLQYFQMRQLNSRNPQMAQANPQMVAMQRYMPIIFAVIYINIPGAVNVYFIFSNLCRIGIQEFVFRTGMLERARSGARRGRATSLPGTGAGGAGKGGGRRSIMDRLAEAQRAAIETQQQRQAALQAPEETPNAGGAKPGSQKPGSEKPGSAKPGGSRPTGGASSGGGNKNGSGPGAGRNGKPGTGDAGTEAKPHPRSRTKRERRDR